jgi:type III pantothenate kinase
MILVIDVGNTNVDFAFYEGKNMVKRWWRPTANSQIQTSKQIKQNKAKIEKVIISSVVPAVDQRLKRAVQRLWGIKPHFVTAENISGIRVRVRKKKEVGADRVVDALAAYKLYGGPAIIVDFGTATTFDVITANGEYLGGAIAPGISLARDALYNQTAKLPKIAIQAPKLVIGNDTESAMQSGLVYGYVAMVEGMIGRIITEFRKQKVESRKRKAGVNVIATGGLARLICKYTNIVDKIDDNLTLEGLRMIGEELDD